MVRGDLGVWLVTSLWGIVKIKELCTALHVFSDPPSPTHVFLPFLYGQRVHWNKFIDRGEGEIACEERSVMIEMRGRETEECSWRWERVRWEASQHFVSFERKRAPYPRQASLKRMNRDSVDQRVLNFSQRSRRLGHLVWGGEVWGWVLEKGENSF